MPLTQDTYPAALTPKRASTSHAEALTPQPKIFWNYHSLSPRRSSRLMKDRESDSQLCQEAISAQVKG